MDNTDRVLDMAQDMAAVQAWMLGLLHGLETGVMPIQFITFNDTTLYDTARNIEKEIEKRGVLFSDEE